MEWWLGLLLVLAALAALAYYRRTRARGSMELAHRTMSYVAAQKDDNGNPYRFEWDGEKFWRSAENVGDLDVLGATWSGRTVQAQVATGSGVASWRGTLRSDGAIVWRSASGAETWTIEASV